MNAYEYAEIMEVHDGSQVWEHGLEIANVLRQQADRIAELEGEVSHLKHINKNWSISEGWALQRVADLEKQLQESAMRNISITAQADDHYAKVKELEKQLKPIGNGTIGYLNDIPINDLVHRKSLPLPLPENVWTSCVACGQRVTSDSIHTCSPQTKPSPDELIDPKSYYIGYEDGKKAPQTKPLSDEEIESIYYKEFNFEDADMVKFARAIEAKVRGEK